MKYTINLDVSTYTYARGNGSQAFPFAQTCSSIVYVPIATQQADFQQCLKEAMLQGAFLNAS